MTSTIDAINHTIDAINHTIDAIDHTVDAIDHTADVVTLQMWSHCGCIVVPVDELGDAGQLEVRIHRVG